MQGNDRTLFISASAEGHSHIFRFICDFLPASACDGGGGGGYNPEVIWSTKSNVIIDIGGHYSKMASDALLRQ